MYEWRQVTAEAAFAPRDGAGAVVFGGRMWLIGGWNPGDKGHFPRICSNDVWSSGDGVDWRLEKPNTFGEGFDAGRDWEGRHTAGYGVWRDRIWIVGGDANQGHYQTDVWSAADGKVWEKVANEVPWGRRVLHYTVVFDDKLWVMGGQTLPQFAVAEEQVFGDVWCTDDGVSWEQVETRGDCWQGRGMIGGAAVKDGRMWVIGGGIYDTPARPQRQFFGDVWSSADGVEWQCHTDRVPWTPRQYHEVAAFDGRLWVLEGWNGQNRNDVWHSADGVEWQEVPETPWAPRHAASVFVYDGGLWMVAGNNMESDVWVLRRKGE